TMPSDEELRRKYGAKDAERTEDCGGGQDHERELSPAGGTVCRESPPGGVRRRPPDNQTGNAGIRRLGAIFPGPPGQNPVGDDADQAGPGSEFGNDGPDAMARVVRS